MVVIQIIYPNTKAFNRIQGWKEIESGESNYHMPSVSLIFVNSQKVNCTNIRVQP